MDLMRHRYKTVPGHVSLDGYALAKGWFVTLGLWLGGSLLLALWADVTRVEEPDTASIAYLDFWSIFAFVSVGVAMFIGLPLALILDRLLRGVRRPGLHIAAFFAFFTLIPVVLAALSTEAGLLRPFLLFSVLGICAAIGRAVAFRRNGKFRRPTTWA